MEMYHFVPTIIFIYQTAFSMQIDKSSLLSGLIHLHGLGDQTGLLCDTCVTCALRQGRMCVSTSSSMPVFIVPPFTLSCFSLTPSLTGAQGTEAFEGGSQA